MNKHLIKVLLCLIPFTLNADICDSSAQSYLFPRPLAFHAGMRQAVWHDFIYHKIGCQGSSVQAIGAVQLSANNKRLARYFLLNHQEEIVIAGDNVKCDKRRDVRAEYLGLDADYASKLTLNPSRNEYGVMLEYNQDLGKFTDIEFFKNSWVSVLLPIVHVEHNLRPCERPYYNGQTLPETTALTQLSRKELKYGRFYSGKKELTRVSDLRFQLGKAFVSNEVAQISQYNTFIIPTNASQDGEYLFGPVVGFNGHTAYGSGVNVQFLLNRDTSDYCISFYANLEHVFAARHEERRTVDVIDKPWSRYMLLYEEPEPGCPAPTELVPATRHLTRELRVKPYSSVDLSLGWRYKTECWEGEIGYDIWGHGDETLEFHECRYPNEVRYLGFAGSAPGTTASESTIANKAANDTSFVVIRDCDLDFESGISKSTITHKFHIAVGHQYVTSCDQEIFSGFGFFYEIPQRNTAFQQWGFWGKIGISF